MSASYTRVNWADYPATTTPVNAENLNKMDAGIASLTSEINSVESDVSSLNSRLSGIDIRYLSANGTPEWSPRGADTWSPFSGCVKGYVLYYGCATTTGFMALSKEGSVIDSIITPANASVNADYKTLLETADWVQSATFTRNPNMSTYQAWQSNIVVAKSGYYTNASRGNIATWNPVYLNAGDTLSFTTDSSPVIIMYHGSANPVQ